jgi:protein TonB
MRALSDLPFVLVLAVGSTWAADKVRSKDGRIVLEDASGHTTALTETGLDSDPWISPDGQTVLFLRRSTEDMFRTSVYEIDMRTRTPRLLYSGPAKYERREGSYFGRPELNESHDTLFLVSNEYATEGSLIAIQLANGQARLISDHVVGYDIIACPTHRGDLIALKRQSDILDHPYFLYWLYSPSGEELGLAGAGELDINMDVLRDGSCPEQQPSAPSPSPRPEFSANGNAMRIEGSVMERQLVTRVDPKYPRQAQLEHIQGDVRLAARVAADGAVQEVSVISGPPQLVEAAIAAAKQWKYRPTIYSGHPVPVVTVITVRFRLPSAVR